MRLPFLRKSSSDEEPLIVAMTGLRMGEAVLFSGRSASLALPLAARTGLSGRCLVFGPQETTTVLEAAATREGLLVETADAPPADAAFDLAVVEAGGPWAPAAAACLLAVRPGGRIVIASGPPRTGLLGRLGGQPPGPEVEAAIVAALTAQGWLRPRGIGTRDGVQFVEAFRQPPPASESEPSPRAEARLVHRSATCPPYREARRWKAERPLSRTPLPAARSVIPAD